MAVSAYVLINIDAGKAKNAVASLRKIQQVKSAHIVTGLHDAIAFVEAPDLNSIISTVTEKIQKVPGVSKTVTCISAD